MPANPDPWFILLPDGRILRARTTEGLRHHLKTGGVPLDCRVRKSPDDPWQTLDRFEQLADLAPKDEEPEPAKTAGAPTAPKKQRAAGSDLRTLGLRGLVDELFDAFDSSLQHSKLVTSTFTGMGIGISLVIGDVAISLIPPDWAWLGYLGTGILLLILFGVCTTILTQLTALELSRFRPAQFSEIRSGLILNCIRLIVAFGLIGGLIIGLIILLRSLPGWIAQPGQDSGFTNDTLVPIVSGARRLLEVICWPIFGLAMLLMGPVLIVEEYSIWQGLREWLGMLKQHIGRIYLYQAITFAYALVLALPMLVPIVLVFSSASGAPRVISLSESVPFYLLLGLTLTPMLNYLLVAHVFIYLNLRYEFFYSARER